MAKVKSPAWKNLTEEQLRKCIEMGEGICEGREDLVELDRNSLRLRGKKEKLVAGRRVDVDSVEEGRKQGVKKDEKGEEKKKSAGKDKKEAETAKKPNGRKKDGEVSKYFTKQSLGKHERDDTQSQESDSEDVEEEDGPRKAQKVNDSPTSPTRGGTKHKSKSQPDMSIPLSRIEKSNKTPFQKQVLTLLCQVPPGHYTTYGLISNHLSSSARAVGNALRNNPFAPEVPCHRVLATGGALGGFGGSWGRNGQEGLNDNK